LYVKFVILGFSWPTTFVRDKHLVRHKDTTRSSPLEKDDGDDSRNGASSKLSVIIIPIVV
jgi:hypothetical protein